jgi:hypothetical protein
VQILTAATYPLEIVIAARWVADPKHAALKGDALTQALQAQSWDPSVKSLVPFPDVLKMMSDKLDRRNLADLQIARGLSAAEEPMIRRLSPGGKWIRTLGSAREIGCGFRGFIDVTNEKGQLPAIGRATYATPFKSRPRRRAR